MTLDPRWSVFLSLGLALLGVLAGSSSQFTDLGMDPKTVKAILGLITIFIGMGNAINAVLGMVPSKPGSQAFYLGPKVDPNAPVAKP